MATQLQPGTGTTIVGKSPGGATVVVFENRTMAVEWRLAHPKHSVTFFERTTVIHDEILDIE